MIITLVSCFLNHHQLMLCNALIKHCDRFYYISTDRMPEERRNMGYSEMDYQYDFVLRTYDGSTSQNQINEVLAVSDAVIFGACPDSMIEYRMSLNKLSFLASERFFKKGAWRRFVPKTYKAVFNRTVRYADKEFYVLCASAFLCRDIHMLGFPAEKCFRWGYFPETDNLKCFPQRNNTPVKLLWAGRLLDWKHAEDAVKAAGKLKKAGVDFELELIGDGPCKDKLIKLAKKAGLEKRIVFSGAMSPDKVRDKMRTADIYLMTSNFYEGWGAVVNEAMSCGCAVLASSAAGSVPYLIEDGKNGVVYKYGSIKDMSAKLSLLIADKAKRKKLGENAINTINNLYSAEVAAERLADYIKQGKNAEKHENGPMSKAQIIKNHWYR